MALITSIIALPFKVYSYGVNVNNIWTLHNSIPVAHPVLAKKCYFSGLANYLPNTQEPYGSVWRQHMGQVTYFTPGVAIAPAWVCVYLAFFDNFVGQKVKIVLNNTRDLTPHVLSDWTTISYLNGQFLPILQPCELITLAAGVTYWVEFHFETTINKAPGFYGEDGIEGFLAKSWWSISQAPTDSLYTNQNITGVF